MPFLFVGYLAAAVGLLFPFLLDYWIFRGLVLLVFGVMMVIQGAYGWAAFAAIGVIACVVGFVRDARKPRSSS